MVKSIGYSKVYASETAKIRPKLEVWFERFGIKSVIDIGCGADKLTTEAFGVDGRALPGVNYVTKGLDDIYNLYDLIYPITGKVKIVYSSHTLEHLSDDVKALNNWVQLTDDDGIVFLYLPDDQFYANDTNPEHVQRYAYKEFVDRFSLDGDLSHFDLVDHGPDVGFDRYSFYVVFKRL